MSRTFDYSEYKHDEYEKEKARHRGNSSISFDVFQNKVIELKDERALLVYVDDFFEEENNSHIFAEVEGYASTQNYLESYHQEVFHDNPDYYQMELEKIKEQKQIISDYSKKFEIHSLYESEEQANRDIALTSALAGAVIKIPLGEGILDFCYADFRSVFNKNLEFYSLFSHEMWNKLREKENLPPKEMVIEIKNKNDSIVQTYFRYTDAITALGDIMNLSLFSLINPLALINQNGKAYDRYQNYLVNLQQELLNLLEFCYDETYFPKLFGKMTPAEKFTFYSKINRKQSSYERTEIFQLGSLLSASSVPITHSELSDSFNFSEIDDESLIQFTKQYDMPADLMKLLLTVPSYTTQFYECSTVFDMLMLEFTKMLEHNI